MPGAAQRDCGAHATRGVARLGALVALVALICAFTAAQARAATYTVGTTADNAGTCVPTSTSCSLRQLIDYEDALASTPSPADVIVVPAGSYTLSNGPLVIDQSVAIDGAGARQTNIYQQTTSATSRVFDIQLNAQLGLTPTVTIAGLATFFGAADSSNGFFGGDIRNRGNLTLSGDLIANGNTNSGSGAGISNDGGTMDVTHSLVENNFSDEVEGGGDSGGSRTTGTAPSARASSPSMIRRSPAMTRDSAAGSSAGATAPARTPPRSSTRRSPTTTAATAAPRVADSWTARAR